MFPRLITCIAAGCMLVSVCTATAQDEMPNAFDSLLVVEADFGDGEILPIDMVMSYCNEADPALVLDPLCNAFLVWDGVVFSGASSYAAEDEAGMWEAYYEILGQLSLDKSMELNGLDLPFLDFVSVTAEVTWFEEDGSETFESWFYTIYDVPPAYVPSGDEFDLWFGEAPEDSLTYSIRLNNSAGVSNQFEEIFNSAGFDFADDPDLSYSDQIRTEDIQSAEFNLVLYFMDEPPF